MDTSQSLMLTIKTPEEVLFEGEVDAITSGNEKGTFDVLPFHENFITIINQTLTVHEKSKNKRDFPIQTGVIRVKENKVQIYLGLDAVQTTT